MKVEVSLSEAEVKIIIGNYLRKKFRHVGEVKIDTTVTYKGTGEHSMYPVSKFNAIKVEVEV